MAEDLSSQADDVAFEQWLKRKGASYLNLSMTDLLHEAFKGGLARASSFRPMESAPKDGTRILVKELCGEHGEFVSIARWDGDVEPNRGHHWVKLYDINDDHEMVVTPTGWLPLPNA